MRIVVHENQLKVLDRSSLVTNLLGSSMKASFMILTNFFDQFFNMKEY